MIFTLADDICQACGCVMPNRTGPGRPRKRCLPCSKPEPSERVFVRKAPVTARDLWMLSLYKKGKTMQEIADVYGMSRERVRQLLARRGMKSKEGGLFKRRTVSMIENTMSVLEKKKLKYMADWGVTPDEFAVLNEYKIKTDPGSKAKAFFDQRRNAKTRGIEWKMNFQEWCLIWEQSGRWPQRGRMADQYVMCRKMDTGPYSVENVQIKTQSQNIIDYQARLKIHGVRHTDGYKRLPENPVLLEASP